MDSARVIIEVLAGVIPGTPEPEFTRRFTMSSEEWQKAGDKQAEKLAELNGRAAGYAALLQLQPDRLNWVRTEWLWM